VRSAIIAAVVSALVTTAIVLPVTLTRTGGAPAETAPAETAPATEAAGGADDATTPVDTTPTDGALSIADVADAVAPSVARVDVQVAGRQGSGSAVVYRSDGHLLTNAHVVSGANAVAVTLPEGTRLQAEVVGADEQTDLAVLRVDLADVTGGELPAPTFADALPRIGETAVAIGSPFELDGSVTAGIVSGLGRSHHPGTPLGDLIQTDAPINPGNSGGALVNDRAEVIGINTAILPASPTARGNIGIGFAIR
jgi:S1-C subfamily serine protease